MFRLNRYAIFLILCIFLSSCSNSGDKNGNNKKQQESNVNISTDIKLESSELKLDLKEEFKDYKFFAVSEDKRFAYFSYFDEEKIACIRVDINSKDVKKIYEKRNRGEITSIAYKGIFENNPCLVEVYQTGEEEFLLNFVLLKNDEVYESLFSEEMKGDKLVYLQIPYFHRVGNKIVMTDLDRDPQNEDSLRTKLMYYDLEKREIFHIDSTNFTSSKIINGDYILLCGGFEDKIYYQVISYDNSNTLEEGKTYIKKANFVKKDDNIADEKIKYEIDEFPSNSKENKYRKLLFLKGDDNLLITSDYTSDKDLYNTGNLYIFSKDGKVEKSFVIPNVKSGNNIVDALKFKDFYLIYTNEDYYIYDKFGNLKLQEKYGAKSSKIFKLENEFYYALKENNTVNIKFKKIIEK